MLRCTVLPGEQGVDEGGLAREFFRLLSVASSCLPGLGSSACSHLPHSPVLLIRSKKGVRARLRQATRKNSICDTKSNE